MTPSQVNDSNGLALDLRRVYETPCPERAGRLPLGQAS